LAAMFGLSLDRRGGWRCGAKLRLHRRIRLGSLAGQPLCVFPSETVKLILQVMQLGLVSVQRRERIEEGQEADHGDRTQKKPDIHREWGHIP
jgi:hypothetical protein